MCHRLLELIGRLDVDVTHDGGIGSSHIVAIGLIGGIEDVVHLRAELLGNLHLQVLGHFLATFGTHAVGELGKVVVGLGIQILEGRIEVGHCLVGGSARNGDVGVDEDFDVTGFDDEQGAAELADKLHVVGLRLIDLAFEVESIVGDERRVEQLVFEVEQIDPGVVERRNVDNGVAIRYLFRQIECTCDGVRLFALTSTQGKETDYQGKERVPVDFHTLSSCKC